MEALARTPRRKKQPAAEAVAVELLSALFTENVSFTTYALMIAVRDHPTPAITLARLAIAAGMSYHAVRQQVLRNYWFKTDHSGPLVTVSLIPEALTKLSRIARRLARD